MKIAPFTSVLATHRDDTPLTLSCESINDDDCDENICNDKRERQSIAIPQVFQVFQVFNGKDLTTRTTQRRLPSPVSG